MERVAVVTGGSSGIGKALCEILASNGLRVYELSRSGIGADGIAHISVDVTDEKQVSAALKQVFEKEGRLDYLFCNAGMGISGAIEYTSLSDARRIFDVNFFGTFLTLKHAAQYLRKTSGSRVICTSSVAAPIAIPFQGFYSATKAAVNSLASAYSNELRPFGVKVSVVMPGDAHTGFTDARVKNEDGFEIYGEKIRGAVESMEKDELGGMSAELVAKVLFSVSQKKNPRLLYTAGGKYKLFTVIAKLLPATLTNRLVGMIYG